MHLLSEYKNVVPPGSLRSARRLLCITHTHTLWSSSPNVGLLLYNISILSNQHILGFSEPCYY